MAIRVDIKTRFIGDEHRVYIVFPGEGYRFYDTFLRESVIFLDIPGYPVPEGVPMSRDRDSAARFVISERIAAWHNKGRPENELPPRTVAELGRFRQSDKRAQMGTRIQNFFGRLKRGDVVIVPPQRFDQDVLYGEIVDDPDTVTLVDAPRHRGETIPARRVVWRARQRRLTAPGWLERRLPNQNPVRQLEEPYHKYVYDFMYARYFYKNEFVCRFKIDTEDFSSLDNFLIQQLFLYTTALFAARNTAVPIDVENRTVTDVVSSIDFSEDIPGQRIQIESPGNIVLYGINIIPLVTGVLMSLAAAVGPEAIDSQLVIDNSSDNSHISAQCTADIQQEVLNDLNAMGYARWQEVCLIEARARERTNVDPGMTTGTVPDGNQQPE